MGVRTGNPAWVDSATVAEAEAHPERKITAAKLNAIEDAIDAIVEGGGGASTLDDLTDVDTSGQTTGDVLKYNGTSWVADAASAGTVTSTSISDSTATGRAVLTAADAATARTAIGAGTSDFDGAYGSLSGTPTLGTAAAEDVGDFAAASHSHPVGDLTATGTRDATTVLHGDNTWKVPAGGGGGGGGSAPPVSPPGGIYVQANARGNATATPTLDRLYLLPMILIPGHAYTAVGAGVSTESSEGGAVLRLGLYERAANGTPGDLIVDAGTVSVTTTGWKGATISITGAGEMVYVGLASQVVNTGLQIRVVNNNGVVLPSGLAARDAFEAQGYLRIDGVTGALPASASTATYGNHPTPCVGLQ